MNPTRSSFPRKLAVTAGWVLAIVCCFKWVDRPASLWAHKHVHNHGVFIAVTHVVDLIVASVCLGFGAYGVGALFFGRKSYRLGTAFGCCLSVAVALTLREALKSAFGRTWPETFVGNPSWISDGVFGFFPFHGGVGWTSFPSGHTAVVSAFAGVLWQRVPALRAFWLALMVAVMLSLYAADYHWISDIVAGLALGLFCAKTTGALLGWDAAGSSK